MEDEVLAEVFQKDLPPPRQAISSISLFSEHALGCSGEFLKPSLVVY